MEEELSASKNGRPKRPLNSPAVGVPDSKTVKVATSGGGQGPPVGPGDDRELDGDKVAVKGSLGGVGGGGQEDGGPPSGHQQYGDKNSLKFN